MRNFTIQALTVLACLYPGAASAADCALKLISTIPIQLADNDTRVLASVTINGTEKKFLLDTGGAMTQISEAAAEDLKLPILHGDFKMLDIDGNVSTRAAIVGRLGLGQLEDRNAKLPLTSFRDGGSVSGLLAANYMGQYDIELDFAGGKMNWFSQDHCPGKVIHWPASAVAALPMLLANNHLILDVTLDGHPFRAIVDTGASVTTLDMAEAKRVFGLTADDANKGFEHIFQKLSFEGLEVGNPHVVIIPVKVGTKDHANDFVTGSRIRREDDSPADEPAMLIGMNILSKLHLYIAFGERKIYITPASPPPSIAPAAAAP
jgi:predicted aspartyl protease